MSVKLYYVKIANRGGSIRDALRIGKIAFENIYIPPAGAERDALADRVTPLLRQWPVLEVDGKTYTQSNAILTYVGLRASLVPHDLLERLRVDEILNACEDVYGVLGPTMRIADAAEKLAARAALIAPEGKLTALVKFLNHRYAAGNGTFVVSPALTIADLKARHVVNWLQSGQVDGIPKDWLVGIAPTLAAAIDKVNAVVLERAGDASGI